MSKLLPDPESLAAATRAVCLLHQERCARNGRLDGDAFIAGRLVIRLRRVVRVHWALRRKAHWLERKVIRLLGEIRELAIALKQRVERERAMAEALLLLINGLEGGDVNRVDLGIARARVALGLGSSTPPAAPAPPVVAPSARPIADVIPLRGGGR